MSDLLNVITKPGNARSDDLGTIQQIPAGGGGFSAGSPQNSFNSPLDESLPKNQLSLIKCAKCGKWAIMTECEGEAHHQFIKQLLCGLEWCSECSQDGSGAHLRRIARWLPKARQIETMGYFVIEYPNDFREYLRDKAILRDQSSRIVDALAGKREGRKGRVGGFFKRGVMRWHWFGDKVVGKLNPHTNALVDGEFIDYDRLEEIKAALRSATGVSDLIVHYSYVDTPSKKYHKLKYITRATFKQYDWDAEFAETLYNFRNARWWGKWKDEPVWDIERQPGQDDDIEALKAIEALGTGECCICHSHLKKWSRAFGSKWIEIWQAEELGHTGYYSIPKRTFQGDAFSPGDMYKLYSDLKLSIGSSYLHSDVVDARYAEFHRQHQRFAANWLHCQSVDEADYWSDNNEAM